MEHHTMKAIHFSATLLGCLLTVLGARAQTLPWELRQNLTPYNLHSQRGVPISSVTNTPPGSDGRAPTAAQQQAEGLTINPPTTNQFGGLLNLGATPGLALGDWQQVSNSIILKYGTNAFSATVAQQMQLPQGLSNGVATFTLRRAQVGATFMSREISFFFASAIPVPETDESGRLLTNVVKETYWLAQPHTTNDHLGSGYYWSPHARLVYAVQPGPITITWRKATPISAIPTNEPASNYYLDGGNYYRLFTESYVVSGNPAKPPRKIYWTEGQYANTGRPVDVPSARVADVNIVYNSNFPEFVSSNQVLYVPGQEPFVPGITDRTLWYDNTRKKILARNQEGRVFLELLGEFTGDNQARRPLGVEIVDVYRQVSPSDVVNELGEAITAFQDGRDDSHLVPEPVLQGVVEPFAYRHMIEGSSRWRYYAIRETRNVNDLLIHWLESGEQGLLWPSLFARYALVWPTDPARYSHYVRPIAATETEARLTAVPLPMANVPMIDYQDPLDRPRAKLTEKFEFFTYLDAAAPAHRTLLRFTSGEHVAFERVFSWLDANLISTNFAGTLATNLAGWNLTNQMMQWPSQLAAPRVVSQTVEVGQRITAPAGELGADAAEGYLAGYIQQAKGNGFNPNAYRDPFLAGFTEANLGAIIPVNAIPGRNTLEVWWFRNNSPNLNQGFQTIHWPSVIGRYTVQWPASPREIVLASNDGSGGLSSLEAVGHIYVQNDPNLAGYNPNEEHALMLGGQAYALRDDLNITTGTDYSSEPFVLIEYALGNGRPAMSAFKVLREKISAGIVFDYIVEAGQLVQAPMPLPLLPKPVEGVGASARNYNTEPLQDGGDLPVGWDESLHSKAFGHYPQFTFEDRKHSFWIYRGPHGGLPTLAAGTYNVTNETFGTLPTATAVVDQDFSVTLHASRRTEGLLLQAASQTPLPAWLQISGLTLVGQPAWGDLGTNTYSLVTTDIGDGSRVTNALTLCVVASGLVAGQAPLELTSTNQYARANVTYVGRPPALAAQPAASNSFTMRFYYQTQEGFAWPGFAPVPAVGDIVPYLLPRDADGKFAGDPTDKTTPAQDIVYRPVWPANPPQLRAGQTLTAPTAGLPAIRGQSSVEVLYQQSIAADLIHTNDASSVVLHDPTREKEYDITEQNLDQLPAGIRVDHYQGRVFFPNLPPHLAQRLYFDPNRGSKGKLVLKGEFMDEAVGEKFILLNVLRGSDLAAAKDLCPTDDPNKSKWNSVVTGLATVLETFHENPDVPGQYVPDATKDMTVPVTGLAEIVSSEAAVDSYALSASGPGFGYVTLITGNGRAFTPAGEPVSVHVLRVTPPLHVGELKILASANPLNELLTIQHTADLAGRFNKYEYEWKIAPPVDGQPPAITELMTGWNNLATATDLPRYTLGGAGVQVLVDNYLIMRYRPVDPKHPLYNQWSAWTQPQLAEGWIKRVLAAINPFNQRVSDLFNNRVNTDASILTQAGARWEGDVALNLETINNYGLIEIYETVLRRGRMLSVDAGINFGPANDTLLLAAGYLNDLYLMLGSEAWADAANPTIGIGTQDATYGDIATALFAFKGQMASVLEEELALLRGRDDFLQPGVETAPVYNRLFWNHTRGIDAGEVIYALNYNIQDSADSGGDGVVNADDARRMFPQGHGDAYGHYLTALKGYYGLLLDKDFDWVPRTEAVTVLGKPVQVDYLDERKFAAAAAATARAGRQVFDLTWRRDYQAGNTAGWEHFGETRANANRTVPSTRHWGMDHWASRTVMGAYVNWMAGNAILPETDPDPTHEGIQKIDRSTVPELKELPTVAADLQTALDNAEGNLNPLGLPSGSIALDLDPSILTGANSATHFEQVYGRASGALQNALAAFDDAKDVTRLMRSEQDSLAGLQASVANQELAYKHSLIELYGTPYPDDTGPGKTYKQGYNGPDLIHYSYVNLPESTFGGLLTPQAVQTFKVDITQFPEDWGDKLYTDFDFVEESSSTLYTNYFEFVRGPHGFFDKPESWTSRRQSPGKIQQSISDLIKAHDRLSQALVDAEWDKANLDRAIKMFDAVQNDHDTIRAWKTSQLVQDQVVMAAQFATDIYDLIANVQQVAFDKMTKAQVEAIPQSLIVGLATGGDVASGARAAIEAMGLTVTLAKDTAGVIKFIATKGLTFANDTAKLHQDFFGIAPVEWNQEQRNMVTDLGSQFGELCGHLTVINQRLRELEDAENSYRALVAQGERLQEEREISRQRAAAIVQGYRTRDAAFRVFRNEKLERYKTLFDLAARYSFLAANAYDYETGLLNTPKGREFINRIISARALGVMRNGQPQYAGSDTGDPGLSSALAEMKADWDVLRGRLGFNNPDAYGTTVSLRRESLRILPGTEGDSNWKDALQSARKANLLDDPDVRRHCLQIDDGSGLPVPGLVITFNTTIARGLNLFGQPLAAGDMAFSSSSFATKIFAVGVALEGYRGMSDPSANSSAVSGAGGTSPSDPSSWYLDPLGLAGAPEIYLIPVGVDSMRSPPLGDTSAVRTWSVDDVTIPMPFNIGDSGNSTLQLWQSGESLTEPLFSIRKHQAFRPVSSSTLFSDSIYGPAGQLAYSQYTNRRLIGRSAWNSQWKLVIPGYALLHDPNEGLERFLQTVTDVNLHFITYSYSGN